MTKYDRGKKMCRYCGGVMDDRRCPSSLNGKHAHLVCDYCGEEITKVTDYCPKNSNGHRYGIYPQTIKAIIMVPMVSVLLWQMYSLHS